MADILHGNTQLANWLPTNFGPAVEGFFRSNLGIMTRCYDASPWATGGKTVTYPTPGALTAVAKTTETLMTEHIGTASAETAATINMSTQYAVPLLIELITLKQLSSNMDLMMDLASRGAYALMKKFENTLALVIQTATTNDVTLGTDNTITWAKLAEAWGKLGNYNIAPADTALGLSGPAWAVSMADWGDKYTSAADRGDSQNFLQTGNWGVIGRTPVFVTDDWESDGTTGDEAGSLWAKNAIGYAIQGGVDTLGPNPHILGGGYELGLYMNWGSVLAINAGVANFNNP